MLKPTYLYRNARSGEFFELFLVTAVSSVLLTRFYLHLAHYPQLGGSKLHIAHMLPGGILMAIALILVFSFIGSRVLRLASVIGGFGFGLFIDELGKFITRDNNYFFRPTIALIYLIFMVIFIIFRTLARRRQLTEREYLLNAVMILEEAVIDDLDSPERNRALEYLRHADQKHPLVAPLQGALRGIKPVEDEGGITQLAPYHWLERQYGRIIRTRMAAVIVDLIFITKALVFLSFSALQIYQVATDVVEFQFVLVSALGILSAFVSSLFVIVGVWKMRTSQLRAYELFSRSLIIDIFITQFFAFYQNQFGALLGFAANVALYAALQLLIRQERRETLRSPVSAAPKH